MTGQSVTWELQPVEKRWSLFINPGPVSCFLSAALWRCPKTSISIKPLKPEPCLRGIYSTWAIACWLPERTSLWTVRTEQHHLLSPQVISTPWGIQGMLVQRDSCGLSSCPQINVTHGLAHTWKTRKQLHEISWPRDSYQWAVTEKSRFILCMFVPKTRVHKTDKVRSLLFHVEIQSMSKLLFNLFGCCKTPWPFLKLKP